MNLTVVIPARDNADTVVSALHSVLSQGEGVEVVVVDDGSTDSTASIVENFVDHRVKLIRRQNGGPSAARNLGARSASGEALIFLDADDELLAGSVERFDRELQRGAEVVRSGALSGDGGAAPTLFMAEDHPKPFPRGAPLAGTFAIATEFFLAIGGYDELFRYGENSEVLMRAKIEADRRGSPICFLDVPTLRQIHHPDRPSDFYTEQRLASVERMLEKHGSELRRDRETLAAHCAIASDLNRQSGHHGLARDWAFRALRASPTSVRSWGRAFRASLSSR